MVRFILGALATTAIVLVTIFALNKFGPTRSLIQQAFA